MNKSLIKKMYVEVLLKNVLILSIFLLYIVPEVSYELEVLQKSEQGGVLSILGFLMAGGIVGAFELSYLRTKLASPVQRYLAHLSKFILYLAVCILIWIGHQTLAINGAYYTDWISISAGLILCSLFIFDIWDAVSAVEQQLVS